MWPRITQNPHPPIWITGGRDLPNIRKVAAHGYQFASFLQPYETVRALFDTYREECDELGLPAPGPERFGYMPMVCTAETEKQALEGAEHLAWFIRGKSESQFGNPPGYAGIEAAKAGLKGGTASRTAAMRSASMDVIREKGVMVVGTPDSVYDQIVRFHERVGGFGHFLAMMQGGAMTHCSAPGSLDTSLSHAAGLIEIAACHA